MPRFKTPDYGLKMIPVDFQRQADTSDNRTSRIKPRKSGCRSSR